MRFRRGPQEELEDAVALSAVRDRVLRMSRWCPAGAPGVVSGRDVPGDASVGRAGSPSDPGVLVPVRVVWLMAAILG